MAKKMYKSMNTLLEKVKQGSIQDSYKTRTFSNISYFKKKELVKPYLHSIDQAGLDRSISHFITSDNLKNPLLEKTLSRINGMRKAKNSDAIDRNDLIKELRSVYSKFPKEIQRDVFNQYYSDIKKLNFEDRGEHTKNRYKMLDKANDPVTKVITRDSHIKSMIFSRNMVQYYLSMLVLIKEEDPKGYEKLMNQLQNEGAGQGGDDGSQSGKSMPSSNSNGKDSQSNPQQPSSQQSDPQQSDSSNDSSSGSPSNGAGKGDSQQKQSDAKSALDKIMQKFLEKPDITTQGMYDAAMNQAKETSQSLDQMMSKEDMDDMWDEISNGISYKSLEKADDGYINDLQSKLASIEMNSDKIKPFLKKILDRSFSYFSAKEEPVYDEFLNSPQIDSIIDYTFLHPKFRKFSLEDIQVKETKKTGKINVYVDTSGSMGSSASIKDTNMSRLSFAKSLLLKLKKMDVINEIYTFSTSVRKKNSDLKDILTIDHSGGTSLDTVVKHIANTDVNAIIITDADDHCGAYCEKAFFIGVAGARFTGFSLNAREEYVKNKQLIQFNGDTVLNIGLDGRPILT